MRLRFRVELVYLSQALFVVSARGTLVEQTRKHVVRDGLAVRGHVPSAVIAIEAADVVRVSLQERGDLLEDVLDRRHSLRPPETAECGIRRVVRPANRPTDLD